MSMTPEASALLSKAFQPEQIGKLPRVTCKACSESRNRCCDQHSKVNCKVCENYISERHIHLDFVGHALVTARLLDVDPEWSWEPFAVDEDGLPAQDRNGNLWIKLTVLGVTRPGVGDGSSLKEKIGDALRNAAMRFGVALDLWAKQDLHATEQDTKPDEKLPPKPDGDASGSPMDRVNALVGPAAAKLAKACREKGLPWPLTDLDDGQLATFDALYKQHSHKQEVPA